MYVDEDTGCIVIDDIQEGVELLPTPLYQSYLKQIEDLKKEVSDLKGKLISLQKKVSDLQDKLTNIAVAQADANVLAEQARLKRSETLSKICQIERNTGLAIGLFCSQNKKDYTYANYYYHLYNKLLCEVEEQYPDLLKTVENECRYLLPESEDIP